MSGSVDASGGFFGHPRGLSTLFFTEMWERFSYYGMRAILFLQMIAAIDQGGLGWEEESGNRVECRNSHSRMHH